MSKLKHVYYFIIACILYACSALQPDNSTFSNVQTSFNGFAVTSGATDGPDTGDLISWTDSDGRARTAFMVNPYSTLTGGTYGGFMKKYTYTLSTNVVRTVTPGVTSPGFGFVVSQRSSDYLEFSSQYTPNGTKTIVSQGPDHVVIRYSWLDFRSSGGTIVQVKPTVEWTFVTGQLHPVYAVTYDTSSLALGDYSGTAQSPSGDMEFADLTTSVVSGVAWGDKWKFKTTSAPHSFTSTWTYNVANTIPYLNLFNTPKAAEYGVVQTQPYAQHDAGSGFFYSNWNKTSATLIRDFCMQASPNTMPQTWCYTHITNQFHLPANNTRKPIAFKMNAGAVGTNSATKYTSGGTGSITGYPYQSYSTSVVFGATNSVSASVTRTEALVATTLTATKGTVATSGIAGVGRTDTATYVPTGYNQLYSTFDVTPNGSGAVAVSMALGSKTLKYPLFRIFNKSSVPAEVKYDGVLQTSGTNYVASLDSTNSVLWLLLKKSVTGTHTLSVDDVPVVDAGPDVADSSDAPFDAGMPWTGVSIANNQSVGGYMSDVYSWYDTSNKLRTMSLVRNNAADPASLYGGYVRQFTYYNGASNVTAAGRSTSHPGWGYTVHHLNGGLDRDTMSSRRHTGSFRTVFSGAHHAMHEYTWTVLTSQGDVPNGFPQVDRNVNITIQYLVSTGRNQVLWAHTVDTSPLGSNVLDADDRSPYGDIRYDGVESPISGLGWGDRYKFRTTSSPVNFNSTWTYNVANTIPHTLMWTDSNNLEIGAVQTEAYTTKDGGQMNFYQQWNKTSATKTVTGCTPNTQTMPVDWCWTYQMNQYDFPWDANAKRFAWGTNTGAVGQTAASVYSWASTYSGYPYRSSSVLLNLGQKGETDTLVEQMEKTLASTVSATVGTVPTTGPAGVANANTITYATAGYDPVYGTYVVSASGNQVAMSINAGANTLVNPMIRIKSYTTTVPNTIVVGGVTLYKDVDFFGSAVNFDSSNELWLTLNKSITGSTTITVN
jgi:hypothetical protein